MKTMATISPQRFTGRHMAAILVTASGCGTTIKDYGFMLRGDAAYELNERFAVTLGPAPAGATIAHGDPVPYLSFAELLA